jgi:hypothetical protein
MTLPLVSDERLSRFAAGFGWFAALVTFVLGCRFLNQLALPGPQHLLGLTVLLILCLALGATGTLGHLHATLKSIRSEVRPGRSDA